jgi:hypothetical protein
MHEVYDRSPIRVLAQYTGGALQPGQVAFVTARAGVGKSALLVHIALDQLLQDKNVLHVSLTETVEHVRTHYDQAFRAASSKVRAADRAAAHVSAERHRMIHTWQGRGFSVEALERSLDMLAEMAAFTPTMIVVDGVPDDDLARVVPGLGRIARERGLVIWFCGRDLGVERDDVLWGHVHLGLRLSPEANSIRLTRLGRDRSEELPVRLDASTLLVAGDIEGESAPLALPRAMDCTLYSGGANGSEEVFGEIAERWGVQEVNFTFDGHKQVRARGRYVLSPRELAAGDVSLVYVSRRLNRTYSEGTLIRKVLQALWHMVSRSQQVFVIGQIQDDGTVVGGTGWSVELARMWSKSLWVYDQDQERWFRWDGDDWVHGTPVIEHLHFTGTGTRYVKDNARAAVEDLFQRSFGRPT